MFVTEYNGYYLIAADVGIYVDSLTGHEGDIIMHNVLRMLIVF